MIDIESGKRDLYVGKAIEIAKYLQVPPIQLLGLGDDIVARNSNNNHQDSKASIQKSDVINSERELYEKRIEELQKHIAAVEKTCADLRDDKATLRAELSSLKKSCRKFFT